jgi:membrane-associated PAP2 superfamily phosphatase
VHVHEKSLAQKLALIAAIVGGLGVVVAICVSVSSKIKSYTRTYTQAHSPLLYHLLLLFYANSLLEEPKAFALNECPWQVVSARLLLV